MIKKFFYNLIFCLTLLICIIIVFTQAARLINPEIYPVRFEEIKAYPSILIFFFTGIMLAATFFLSGKINNCVKSNPRKYLILLVLIGISLRIVSITLIKNRQVSDFKIYHELAVSLCRGTGFSYAGVTGINEDVKLYLHKDVTDEYIVPTNFRPCGYPFILSLIYRFFGINSFFGKLFNILIGIFGGICLYLLFSEINVGFAFWATVFWFIYPSNIFAVNLLATETVYLSFLIISLFLLKKSFSLSRYKFILIVVSGLFSGYCCLIRPYLFLLLCVVFGLILTAKRTERLFVSIIVFIIAFLLPLFGWGIRNYFKFDRFQIQPNNAGPTLVIRTNHIEPLIGYKYDQCSKKMDTVTDEFKLNRIGIEIFRRRLITCLEENPVGFFTKFLKMNIICAWSHDCDILLWAGRSDFFSAKKIDTPAPVSKRLLNKLYALTNSFFLYISILALTGIIMIGKNKYISDRYILILLCYFILNFILLALYRGTVRYHFDAFFILFILAGYAVSCFGKFINNL